MTTAYVAFIGDAVASRELPTAHRARLQRDLRAILTDFNRRWRKVLAARFAVTQGDEVQCLLTSAAPVWELAHAFRAQFLQVDWVIACGRGPLTTPLTPGVTAPELDGPCFHLARAAVERAKERRLLFAFGGFSDRDATLNGLASYYSALYWSWTPRQRQAARLLRSGGPALAAGALKIDRSAVSHMARRMAWPLAVAGDTMFRTLLGASSAHTAIA